MSIIVNGTGFSGASAVTFGSVPAASFSVINDTAISATSVPTAERGNG